MWCLFRSHGPSPVSPAKLLYSNRRLILTRHHRTRQPNYKTHAQSSQDAAHDLDVLRKFKVTHVLNVAYGVANPFPHLLHYRTVTLLDLPDTDITSYFPEGCAFIEEARAEEGVVLVHCNAGVSRSSSMVIGYLMTRERLAFNDAFSQVKAARPSICPNPGFLLQLKNYNPQASTSS
ncbi:dual specificity protein phosphatase 19-like isoform X4 [Hypomesus transpacificus]|uniref:dual specificity protein phosphatase 19-like isoform X4 n=1 Tax=Hypomesus transpacificus TaxID=137520 RepID=UPI001F072387|nr:dual specificity protein phosphatase 19-like isoform X4 [Hypomesus transpacificus]